MAGRERGRDEWVSLILCSHHRREIAQGPKVEVDILPLKISSEIELSGIQRMGRNVEFSLSDDSIAVGKRFTGAFCGNLKAERLIVDAADQGNKSLNGTKLIGFWLAQYQESDGMFVCIKRLLTAALVTGIGRHLISVPEGKDKERQETDRPRGAHF